MNGMDVDGCNAAGIALSLELKKVLSDFMDRPVMAGLGLSDTVAVIGGACGIAAREVVQAMPRELRGSQRENAIGAFRFFINTVAGGG